MLSPDENASLWTSFASWLSPSIGSFLLAAVLFSRKMGHSIEYHFDVDDRNFYYPKIKNIKLLNKKDKPESIFAIYIFVDNILCPIYTNKNPIIVKSYESVVVEIDDITSFTIEGLDVKPRISAENKKNISVYVSLDRSFHRCREIKRGDSDKYCKNRNIKLANFSSIINDGHVVPSGSVYYVTFFNTLTKKKEHFFVSEEGFFVIDGHKHEFDKNLFNQDGAVTKEIKKIFLGIKWAKSIKIESLR